MAPAPLDLDRNIRLAIGRRRLILVTYNDRARICEPHDYGLINNEPKLLTYQRREDGSSRPPGWRLLAVNKIAALFVLEETFRGSRDDGQTHRFHWDPLICRVE